MREKSLEKLLEVLSDFGEDGSRDIIELFHIFQLAFRRVALCKFHQSLVVYLDLCRQLSEDSGFLVNGLVLGRDSEVVESHKHALREIAV